jgi:hypothetical protein
MRNAGERGFCTAVLVPLGDPSQPLGVLELLTRDSGALDHEVLVSLEAVAFQLGHFAHLLELSSTPQWRTGRV